MTMTKTTRRQFIAASLAFAAVPKLLFPSAHKSRRVLIDPCNETPLAGVRIKLNNLATGEKKVFKSAIDGSWEFDSFVANVNDPEGHRIRATVAPLTIGDIQYAGLEHRFIVRPGGIQAKANRQVGRLSLIPLSHPGRGMEIDDEEFNANWSAFLRDSLFSRERTPFDIPNNSARGALSGFSRGKLRLFLGESLSAAEQEFIGDEIVSAVDILGAGSLRTEISGTIPADQEPFFADDVPSGSLVAVKHLAYPKPTTRIRFGSDNPHEIVAAGLYFDTFTLNSLFRDGAGRTEEISLARHLVQRTVAEVLGYRPTMRLPNRTLLDANFTPQATLFRQGARPEDLLLARVHYGSGWLGPGARLSADGTVFISNDV